MGFFSSFFSNPFRPIAAVFTGGLSEAARGVSKATGSPGLKPLIDPVGSAIESLGNEGGGGGTPSGPSGPTPPKIDPDEEIRKKLLEENQKRTRLRQRASLVPRFVDENNPAARLGGLI